MPAPKSPLTSAIELLAQASTIKGSISSLKIGANNLALQRSPRSIVVYPRRGPISGAMVNTAIRDVDLETVFRLWGYTIDDTWDMRARVLQGLAEIASKGGPFWQGVSETWDDDKDTAGQGQDLELVINLHFSAGDKIPSLKGKASSTSFTREAPLMVALSTNGTSAAVTSTQDYPSSGILYIDDEKLSYASVTPTTFAGLVRGLGGTTAAAHDVGALVRVTPAP